MHIIITTIQGLWYGEVNSRVTKSHKIVTSQSLSERGETIVSKLSPGTDTQEIKDLLESYYRNPEQFLTISYDTIGTSLGKMLDT